MLVVLECVRLVLVCISASEVYISSKLTPEKVELMPLMLWLTFPGN